MIIEISTLIFMYGGFKFFENRKDKKHKKKKKKELQKVSKNIEKSDSLPSEHSSKNEVEKRNQHFFRMSLLTTATSAISQFFFPVLTPVTLFLYAYISYPRAKSALNLLFKKKQMGNDVLIFFAILMGVATGQFFPLSLSMTLYRLGDKIQAKTRDHSKRKLFNLFENQPCTVWLLKDNIEVETSLSEVCINDIIVINNAEIIPVDGVILEGVAMIDQCILTGESKPVEKGPKEKVFASTMILTGRITVKVEKTGQETTISYIGKTLNDVIDFRFRLQSKAEKWADNASGPIVAVGTMALPLLGPLGATTILRSSFGQSLGVISSLHVLNHLRFAYSKSILIKDGRPLEYLDDIDTVLFDKTGTLTEGKLEIKHIIACEGVDKQEVLRMAAVAESKQKHPIAQAILRKAEETDFRLPIIDDSEYHIGLGVKVKFENKDILVGSYRFMNMENIPISDSIIKEMNYSYSQERSFSLIAVNNEIIGAIDFQSVIREEAKKIISDLRDQGINNIGIISGDHKQPTQKLANFLEVDNFFYEVSPEQKGEIVEGFQKEGKSVCFVGDGINDSIAMKKADVAISLSGASGVATDIAQIIFMDGTLSQLNTLFDISKKLNKNLQISLGTSIAPAMITLTGPFLWDMRILSAVLIDNSFFSCNLLNTIIPFKEEEKQKNNGDQSISK